MVLRAFPFTIQVKTGLGEPMMAQFKVSSDPSLAMIWLSFGGPFFQRGVAGDEIVHQLENWGHIVHKLEKKTNC